MATVRTLLPVMVVLLATPPVLADVSVFQTPSGNILCSVGTGEAPTDIDCTIFERSGPPATPRLAGCNAAGGHRFWMRVHGVVKAECGRPSGSVPHGPERGISIVPYGDTEEFDGIVCHSLTTGLECRNADGHGFSLSRQRQSIF